MTHEQLTRVLAAVIQDGDRFLLCRRAPNKRYGGQWEFPGGKLLDGETIEEAAGRELCEELGVQVANIGPMLFECRDPGSQFLIQFVAIEIVGVPTPIEHDELAWVSLNDLLKYELAPTDREFARTKVRSPKCH